jgi:hypothetical protein
VALILVFVVGVTVVRVPSIVVVTVIHVRSSVGVTAVGIFVDYCCQCR